MNKKSRLLRAALILLLAVLTAVGTSGCMALALYAVSGITAAETGVCSTFYPHGTPAEGTVRIPVFLVEFPDAAFRPDRLNDDEVEQMLFDPDDAASMAAFERAASNGRLRVEGDVFSYTVRQDSTDYQDERGSFEKLAMEVLAALDAARGRYISGQELAAQLGVSRTAVWKAVAALRRDGIPIKAVTNRGYTLAQSVDVLNAAAVAAQLDEATVKALQIEVVDRLPGTNAALRSRADAGAREGLVLIAQAQSAGRGRGGHSFYSPPGGLYMSILLRPEIGARQAVGLTAMAAVAAARAAERLCGVPITIKWVNDLWKNGKKVCGILTEAALDLESGMLDYAVLGLGFNVAAPADGWPEDLRDVAGALYDGSPAPGARAALAAAFLNAFWPLYRAGPRSGYLDEYRRRQALTGQRVLVTPRRGTPRAAQVQGIDDECKLVVRFDGESRPAALNSGEVSVRLL